MDLTQALVQSKAAEYREREPLYAVEAEHVGRLRRTVASCEFGWRDVEWPVQWYFRRYLGAYPDSERREYEQRFRDNDFDEVATALTAVLDADAVADKLDRLTALDGVDVRIASAFLLFLFPERDIVVGDREWAVLVAAGKLTDPYPASPSSDAYLTYHDRCQTLLTAFDVDAWTLYRALWRLWTDELGAKSQ